MSKSICDTVNGSHQYTISGYSLSKGIGHGKYLTSDQFTVGGYQWAIYFYPDGKNPEDNSAYVSVFIALASEGTDVRALFELALIDQSGKEKHKVHSHFVRAMVDGPYTLKYRGSMWGYKRFIKRQILESSDYLKDDSLIMHCTVGVVRNRIETPQLVISVPPPDLGNCLRKLLISGHGSDIVFDVDGEAFSAHKLILAARSPVFKAQFYGLIGDMNIDRVVVQDIEPPVFKAMLHFMYTDCLPDLHELAESTSMSTYTNLYQHLLAAADRYGLDRLKVLCEAKLCEQVTSETVASTMALAEQYQCISLKSMCLKFIASRENLGDVLQSEGFGHIEQACPSLLSDLLATVAVVINEDDTSQPNRKRSYSSNIGLNLNDEVDDDSSRRRLRRRL